MSKSNTTRNKSISSSTSSTGNNFSKTPINAQKSILKRDGDLFKWIWFAIILLLYFVYTLINWQKCINFENFDGNNVIFLVFIVLTLLPLIKEVKFSALGADVEAKSALLDRATDEIKRNMADQEYSQQLGDPEQLKSKDKDEVDKLLHGNAEVGK